MLFVILACAGPGNPRADPADTASVADDPLPRGDNLVELGLSAPSGLLESTGALVLDATTVLLCTGASGLLAYDVSDPAAPTGLGRVPLSRPANDLRCQHLAALGDERVAVTHHGDETGDGWLAFVDVSDVANAVQTDAWSRAGTAPEGLAASEAHLWVAAHDEGLLRFDLAEALDVDPTPFDLGGENVSSVAIAAGIVAVGTLDGSVWLLDADGVVTTTVVVAGPVFDLEWLEDGTLAVACGSQGLDRVDPGTASVVAHGDAQGSVLDVAELTDGTLAAASWADLRLYDPVDLTLVGTEDPAALGGDAAVLAVAAWGDHLYVGEWTSFRAYLWDPSVAGPDLYVEVDTVELGDVATGEVVTANVLVTNEGAQDLLLTEIQSSDAGLAVEPSSAAIAPGASVALSVTWEGAGPFIGSLTLVSDDPDEAARTLPVRANQVGVGVGDPLPAFTYLALNSTDTYTSSDLGGPALLSYFATF